MTREAAAGRVAPWTRIGGLATAVWLLAALGAGRVATDPPGTLVQVRLRLDGQRTARQGETAPAVTSTTVLRVGESRAVAYGMQPSPDGTDCQPSVADATQDAQPRSVEGRRTARVTLVDVGPDRVRFRVDDRADDAAADSRELTLREGISHVFAFERGPSEGSCAGVVWAWSAEIVETTVARVDVEAWAETTGPDGTVHADRLVATATTGEVVPISFVPAPARVGACDVRTAVSARLKVRQSSDGTYRLWVTPRRRVEEARVDRGLSVSSAAEGGVTEVDVRSGEAVRIILPPPAEEGLFMLSLPCGSSHDDSTKEVTRFLRAQQTALLIRLTRHGP